VCVGRGKYAGKANGQLLLLQCIPVTWNDLQMLHIWFLAANVLYWISLYAAATTDPGYLPQNAAAYDEAIKQVLIDVFVYLCIFS